jgi:hypothetical protein
MKAKKRTTKKAVTLLTKIETLLSDVLDECAAVGKSVEKNVGVLLRSAEASITVAKEFFIAPEPAKDRPKVAKAAKPVTRHRAVKTAVKPAAAAHKRSAVPASKRALKTTKPQPRARAKRAPHSVAPIANPSGPQASIAAL